MQRLEVSCAVRPIYGLLGAKGLTMYHDVSTCFGRQASSFRRHYTSSFWCELRAVVDVGRLQPDNIYNGMQHTPKLLV
jgi:hypothetical protein